MLSRRIFTTLIINALLLCTVLVLVLQLQQRWFLEVTETNSKRPITQPQRMSLNNSFAQMKPPEHKEFDIDLKVYKVIVWLNPSPWIVRELTITDKVDFTRCAQKCILKLVQVPDNETYNWEGFNFHWDAIIFKGNKVPLMAPPPRNRSQVFIFHDTEPPRYIHRDTYYNKMWGGSFNFTMTYRRDSDIFFGKYGEIAKDPSYPNELSEQSNFTVLEDTNATKVDYRAIYRAKTKMSAWFVSHCNTDSKRELYVNALKNYTDVDIFGGCGQRVNYSRSEAREFVENNYYFYLAFENTICKDYITEKSYSYFERNVIVVVRGGGNYAKYFPRDTVINTADFASVKELGNFLNELAKDEDRYIGYLQRKEGYKVRYPWQQAYCNICRKLHNSAKKSYSSMRQWWSENQCMKPQDIPL